MTTKGLKPLIIVGILAAVYLGVRHVEGLMGLGRSHFQTEEKAPHFALPLVGNHQAHEVKLTDYTGSWVIINFWASWCKVCRKEKPHLDTLWTSIRSQSDATVLGIASYDSFDKLIDHERVQPGFYRVALDVEGDVAQQFRVFSLPQTIVIDPNQNIALRIERPLDSRLTQDILNLLRQANSH